jgi:hypothetical protein
MLEDVIVGVGGLALSALGWLLLKLAKYLGQQTKNLLDDRLLLGLQHAVMTAVRDVHQTYVQHIVKGREDRKLTAEEKRIAKNLALSKAKTYIGLKGAKLLLKSFELSEDELNELLKGKIEADVLGLKRGV